MKIFGIGLNKTGTKTLGESFRIFGFRNKTFDMALLRDHSQCEYGVLYSVIESYDSFEDWPWPLVYTKLDLAYPDAKFVLTVRKNAETWFDSLCKHAERTGPTDARLIAYGYSMPHDFREEHIAFYNQHNKDVADYFQGRESKLLQVCWEDGDGWEALSVFLNRTIPKQPFPHLNKRPSNG